MRNLFTSAQLFGESESQGGGGGISAEGYQDVTSEVSLGDQRTPNTDRPTLLKAQVSIMSIDAAEGKISLIVDGTNVGWLSNSVTIRNDDGTQDDGYDAQTQTSLTAIIPAGSWYMLHDAQGSANSLSSVQEMTL